jgi:hypothetical protein
MTEDGFSPLFVLRLPSLRSSYETSTLSLLRADDD